MERAQERNDFVFAWRAVDARELDGRLVGLGPGVGKKNAVRKAVPHQQLGQFYLWLGVEEIAHVHQLAGLIADGPGHLRLAVAQDANYPL